MTDRMLSAEKVKAYLEDNKFSENVPRSPTARAFVVVVDYDDFVEAIDSGQLDADRPKCPKCKDTGVLRGAQDIRANGDYRGYRTVPCDCGAPETSVDSGYKNPIRYNR